MEIGELHEHTIVAAINEFFSKKGNFRFRMSKDESKKIQYIKMAPEQRIQIPICVSGSHPLYTLEMAIRSSLKPLVNIYNGKDIVASKKNTVLSDELYNNLKHIAKHTKHNNLL